jgi:hypothetical protein
MEYFRALMKCEPEEQGAIIRLIGGAIVKHRVESAVQPMDARIAWSTA